MAEEREGSERTEEPTHRRLEEARKSGRVVSSREVHHWFMLLAAAVALLLLVPQALRDVGRALGRFFESAHAIALADEDALGVAADLLSDVAVAFGPVLALFLCAAIASHVVQHGFVFSVEPIEPKLDKLSPANGLKRLFSLTSLAEFVKGLTKIAIVAAVIVLLMLPEFDGLDSTVTFGPEQLLARIGELAFQVLIGVVAVMTVIAGADYLYQMFEHHKRLRMSRQEIKDEYRETEGDPIIKARIRQIRVERARRRMMAAVPEADVVITNPTHFAVALSYKPDDMSAPRVVAKGVDFIARRIRELAEANEVPVVENPPLARALHDGVEIGAEIPPEHYLAVAKIIGYVMRLKGRLRPA